MMRSGSIWHLQAAPSGARRNFLQISAAAGMLGLLAGCGFALRSTIHMKFSTLYIGLDEKSELGAQLRRYVRDVTDTRVVDNPKEAQAILQVLSDSRERSILSLDASGRVREFELRYLFTFRLHDGKGRDLIPPTTITLRRDLTFNDAATLAKEQEANLLYRDMQAELIQQLLRRMAAVEVV